MTRLTEAELAAKSARNRKAKAETWGTLAQLNNCEGALTIGGKDFPSVDHTSKVIAKAAPSKYRNTKTEVDGILFDSKKEAARWLELKALEASGEIRHLSRQVRVPLVVNGVSVAHWVADFEYAGRGVIGCEIGWGRIWEDVKSDYTRKLPVYRLKKKLVKAIYGVDIRET